MLAARGERERERDRSEMERKKERKIEKERDGQKDSDGNNVSSKILKDHHSSLKSKCWILREIDF